MSENIALDNNMLQKYLKDVISLETDVETQEDLIEKYKIRSSELEPELCEEQYPVAPKEPELQKFKLTFDSDHMVNYILSVLALVLTAVTIISLVHGSSDFWIGLVLLFVLIAFMYIMNRVKNKTKEGLKNAPLSFRRLRPAAPG